MKNMEFYTKVPKEFEKKMQSGEIVRTGVTLRESKTGKIVGHLEVVEKSDTAKGKELAYKATKTGIKIGNKAIKFTGQVIGVTIQGASGLISSLVSSGVGVIANPVTGATAISSFLGNIQNIFIHKDVKETKKIAKETLEVSKETLSIVKRIEASLGGLQTCAWATTVLSAANLGVSVGGFALTLNKLNKIQNQLNGFNSELDSIEKKLGDLKIYTTENNSMLRGKFTERYISLYNQYISNLKYLCDPAFADTNTLRDAKKCLDETFSFLKSFMQIFVADRASYINLDEMFSLLYSFTQLGIAYNTQSYKITGHLQNCCFDQYSEIYKLFFNKQVFEVLRHTYMINSNRLLMPEDYQALYDTLKCQVLSLAYDFKSHEELLNTITYKDFLEEQEVTSQLFSEDGNAIILYDGWND